MKIELFNNVKIAGKIIKAGIITVDDDIAETLIEEGHAEEVYGPDCSLDESDLNQEVDKVNGGGGEDSPGGDHADADANDEEQGKANAQTPEKIKTNPHKKKSKGG